MNSSAPGEKVISSTTPMMMTRSTELDLFSDFMPTSDVGLVLTDRTVEQLNLSFLYFMGIFVEENSGNLSDIFSGNESGDIPFSDDSGGTGSQPTSSLVYIILTSIPLALINILVVVNNIMMIITVIMKRSLRTVTLMFLLNLACADLLLGVIVLPISAIHTVSGRWWFGPLMCNVWATVDILCCTASMITLALVSIDRVLCIRYTVTYRKIMSKSRSFAAVGFVWVLSACTSIVPLLIQGKTDPGVNGTDTEPGPVATCPFVQTEPGYVVFSSMCSFFVPMAVVLGFYTKIYLVASKRNLSLIRGSIKKKFRIRAGSAGVMGELRIHRTAREKPGHHVETKFTSSPSSSKSNSFRKTPATAPPQNNALLPGRLRAAMRNRKVSIFSVNRIATKTIGVVVGAFIVCWTPFFAVYIINSTCVLISRNVILTCVWLGYCNSMLNPIIYTCTNRQIKQALLETAKSLFPCHRRK